MLFFTGDIHGNPIPRFSFKNHSELRELTENDFVFILGDCGVPWFNPELKFYDKYTKPGSEKLEIATLEWMNNHKWKWILLAGNHDNYDLIHEMPHTKLGHADVRQMAYLDKIYENIFYIGTPQYMYLQGQKILLIPGAESHDYDYIFEPDDPNTKTYIKDIDKKFKKTGEDIFYRVNHFSWWENERVNKEKIEQLLPTIPREIDLVLSHAPSAAVHQQWKPYGTPGRLTPSQSELILEGVRTQIEYKMWLHGHLHEYIWLCNLYSLGLYTEILSLNDIEDIYKNMQLENKYQKELFSVKK